MAWIENGPVSIPPKPVVRTVAVLVAVVALAGIGYGLREGWRDGGRSAIGATDSTDDVAAAVQAQPLVTLPPVEPPAPSNAAPAANALADKDEDAANAIAEKTAAAQAAQSKPAQSVPDIDDILTSSSEKPQAPAKGSGDQSGAGSAKNEVPF
ncbi:MAG: hypothetical protein ACREEW_13285 [Caulobacteraceae bacterium]